MSLVGNVFGYAPKVWDYSVRLAKASPYIIFNDVAKDGVRAASAVTRGANDSWSSVAKNMIKEGGKGIESSISAITKEGGFLKAAWKSISEIPSTIKTSVKWSAGRAMVAAKAAGKTGIAQHLAGLWGGTKGIFKGIGKKMPIIGNLLLVAFELPNIFNAIKDEGLIQGGKEIFKTGTRLTAASLASAIGAAAAGPIGGIAGFIIGDWLASKVVGKSYTEQKAEKEEQVAQDMSRLQELIQQPGVISQLQPQSQAETSQNTAFNGTQNPFQPKYPFGNFAPSSNNYSNDIMMNRMNFDKMA